VIWQEWLGLLRERLVIGLNLLGQIVDICPQFFNGVKKYVAKSINWDVT
jgi:hypothetical protein